MSPKTVVVSHREAMVAEGIAAALGRQPGLVPIAATTSAAGAEREGARADAVALDARLPGAEGVAARLRRLGVRVVFIGSRFGDDEAVCVPQSASVAQLASALAPAVPRTTTRSGPLTQREKQVLALVSRGLAGKQVARHLGISPKTVERHKTRIFLKLGVPNQTAAVRVAVDRGYTGSGPWT